jgi:uncharacterized protein
MSGVEIIVLAAAGAAAGMINAVAGGGTLVTFPALLSFGTPAIVANATSALALVIGTFSGAYGYRRQLPAVRPWLRRFVPPSLIGGLIGSLLVTATGERVFSHLVPFLLLFATVLFVTQGVISRWLLGSGGRPNPLHEPSRGVWLAVLFQFLVALYGGYFGAGIGILMLASLGFMGLKDIHEMNCLKTILGSLINQVAAVYFICAGLIDWPRAGVMTAGALAGYFAGAHWSQRIPQKQVRWLISAIGFAITAVMFWKQLR